MLSETSTELSLPLWMRLGLATGGGVLLTVGYALHPVWWAPWLAPALLMPAAGGTRGSAWLMGALAGALSTVSVFTYYLDFSWLATTIIVILRIVSWGGAASLAASAWRRFPPVVAVFVLPAFIAALEVVALTVSVHGAAGSLAYSQMDILPVVQAASWGGVPAVVFLVLLPGSLAGGWLLRRPQAAQSVIAGLGAAGVLAAAGGYAVIRLETPVPSHRLPVTLIASDRFPGIPKAWPEVWATYRDAVRQATTPGRLVVLPEKIAVLDAAGIAAATADIHAVAMAGKATLVVGLEAHDAVYRNRALVARPDGSTAWYDKQRLVPGFEDRDVPGSAPLIFGAGEATIGTAICKDMHIPSIGAEYDGHADVLAVPAFDFGRDGWMGARMTLMRGIEGGYSIARSARNGLIGAYDAYGRVVAETPSVEGVAVVSADVPAARIDTLYTHVRETFGWLCLVFSLAMIGWVRWKRSTDKG